MDVVDISKEIMVVAGAIFWVTVIGAAWFELRVVRKIDRERLLEDVRDEYPEKAGELLKRTAVKVQKQKKADSREA